MGKAVLECNSPHETPPGPPGTSAALSGVVAGVRAPISPRGLQGGNSGREDNPAEQAGPWEQRPRQPTQ